MRRTWLVVPLAVILLFCRPVPRAGGGPPRAAGPVPEWQQRLRATLPRMGHRNWIVIADSAYPAQVAPGIETVVTRADHLDVLNAVLTELDGQPHVRPVVHLDKELTFVPERYAKGIR